MAMSIIFPQFPPTHSFFKLFTLSLPFFCLLLTWGASSSTTPPPSSAASALHSSGHSLFATALTASNSFNATGTILAPPDFAFSSSAAKFNHHHRRTPSRPTTSLLLYHTIKEPLTWQDLHSRDHGYELRTLYSHHCLFLSKTSNGELTFAGSRNSIPAVKILHPDLYVDDLLTVHGIDGVLDPSSATKCSVPNPTAVIKLQVDRSLLDLAIRALKRKGFSVVATAIAIKCFDLVYLDGVTIFAPSDAKLFSFPDGFRYDFRHHVVPNRLRFADIAKLPAETEIETIDPEKTIVIGSVNGNVTINGAEIYSTEIYLNRWISVISISQPFDDEGDNEANRQILHPGVPSMAPIYSIIESEDSGIPVPSTAPIYSTIESEDSGIAVPSKAPSYSIDFDGSSTATELPDFGIGEMLDKVRRDSGDSSAENQLAKAAVPSPASSFSDGSENTSGVTVRSRAGITDCLPEMKDGVVSVVAVEGEGGKIVCPDTAPPRLDESGTLINVDAVQSSPSDAYDVSNDEAPISAVDDVRE